MEGWATGVTAMISIILPNRDEPRIQEVISTIEELFPRSEVVICADHYSQGKGWAIRKALSQAKYDIICFLDGDMDIHPRMIHRLIPFLDDNDIVVGKKEGQILFTRRIVSWLCRFYVRVLFGLPIDTQTGIKLFRRYAIPEWESNGFVFDLEILSKAKKQGYSMTDVYVQANISKPMPIRSILKFIKESVILWFRLNTHGQR